MLQPFTTEEIARTNLAKYLKRACSHVISSQQFTSHFPENSVCVKGVWNY